MNPMIRIATRKSPLALWQAEYVRAQLLNHHPSLEVELVPLSTRGDDAIDTSLRKIGGKGLFVKELEIALLDSRADALPTRNSLHMARLNVPFGASSSVWKSTSPASCVIEGRREGPSRPALSSHAPGMLASSGVG